MVEKIKPLRDRVLIKRSQEEEKTQGGIFIPDAAKERGQKGQVIEVGAKVAEVKVGDVVLFGKYAGTDAGTDHLIIKEEEILGVVSA